MIRNIRFRTFDLGGHETARRIWKDYYATVNGVIFLVDAADRTRFAEAREELHMLLDEPSLRDVPIAVLGNKIDIAVAASEHEVRQGSCRQDWEVCAAGGGLHVQRGEAHGLRGGLRVAQQVRRLNRDAAGSQGQCGSGP